MVFVSDMGEKQALLNFWLGCERRTTRDRPSCWNVDKIDLAELRELITDSWRIKAPPKLRRRFEAQ